MMREMDRANLLPRMVINIMASGKIMKKVEKVKWFTKTVQLIMAIGKMIREMDRVNLLPIMVKNIKEIGKIIRGVVMEFKHTHQDIDMKETSKMT